MSKRVALPFFLVLCAPNVILLFHCFSNQTNIHKAMSFCIDDLNIILINGPDHSSVVVQ